MDSKFELQLLALLLKHNAFVEHSGNLEAGMFSDKADDIYKVICKLHTVSQDDISFPVLRQYALDNIVTAHREIYIDLIEGMEKYAESSADVGVVKEIIETVRTRYVAARIADLAINLVNGRGGSISDILSLASAGGEHVSNDLFYQASIDEILKELDPNSDSALKFTTGGALEQIVPAIFRGMLAIILAGVNVGKSSFSANLGVGFLKQGLKVLYFANEEIPQKMLLNHVRAMCRCTEQDLREKKVGTEAWVEVKNNFYLVAAHGFTIGKIESVIAKVKPDVVFIDQLDNVVSTEEDRRDIQLDKLYQRARLLGAQNNCAVFAISQASDEATDRAVVKMGMAANSKVGKAGAADLIIGIGKSAASSVEEDNLRCLTVSKNKINGAEKSAYVKFYPDRCEYAV